MEAKGKSGLRLWHYGFVASTVGALVAVTALVAGAPATAQGVASHSVKARHHSYDFDAPTSVALVGSNLFVANGNNKSVTEVKASDGSYVTTISGKHFGFDAPTAITAVGGDLFVANSANDSVTEFKAAGHKHIRTIEGRSYGFSHPIALASSGQDLFVLNGTGSVTEVAAATGALVGTASGSLYGFAEPTGLAVADGDVFVANSAANTVTVLKAATRTFVASLSGSSFAFSTPTGVTFDGTNVWVTNAGDSSVTEFSPITLNALNVLVNGNLPMAGPIASGDGYVFAVSPWGSSPMVTQITPSPASVNWMMCNTNGPYLFNNPQSLVVSGSTLWIVSEGSNSLTEMNAVSGDLIQTIFNP
jgi:hypothetical protein